VQSKTSARKWTFYYINDFCCIWTISLDKVTFFFLAVRFFFEQEFFLAAIKGFFKEKNSCGKKTFFCHFITKNILSIRNHSCVSTYEGRGLLTSTIREYFTVSVCLFQLIQYFRWWSSYDKKFLEWSNPLEVFSRSLPSYFLLKRAFSLKMGMWSFKLRFHSWSEENVNLEKASRDLTQLEVFWIASKILELMGRYWAVLRVTTVEEWIFHQTG